MIARLVTLLAILAIAVVTTGTAAHVARMGVSAAEDHAAHAGGMPYAPVVAETPCHTDEHHGSAEAEICETVCAGLSAFLTSPDGEAGRVHGPVSHDAPHVAIRVGRAPDLNERPPKLRLL
jgi:hypothetical protein